MKKLAACKTKYIEKIISKVQNKFWKDVLQSFININKVKDSLKNVIGKSRECHNHKPQPTPDKKRKSNKRTKNTKISSLSSPSEVMLKGLKNTRTK